MAQLVGVGHGKTALDERGGNVLGGFAMAAQGKNIIFGLTPLIEPFTANPMAPRSNLHPVLQAEDTEGWDDLLGEIFILVVAHDNHKIGFEPCDHALKLEEIAPISLMVAVRGAQPLVGAEIGQKRRREAARSG